ncbi:hypothetical protein Tco_0874281 [Tanacetum coccineum]|uniref:Uncharacterized protein n=1 Tax=Tanacetum coccineum TaxID=301880 RepID=A0ABQ5BL71_9ASTR
MNSCGALYTYSLYDKQVNEAGAWANEMVHQAIFSLHSLNRNIATLQIGLITSHLTMTALSIPYWSFVTSGLLSLEPFPSARSPNEEGVSGLWTKTLIPLFVLLLLLGREEDKKRTSTQYIGILKHHHECYCASACGAVRHHPVVPACQLSYPHQATYLMSSFPTGRRFPFPQINEEGRSHLILPENRKRSAMPGRGDGKRNGSEERNWGSSGCFTPNPTRFRDGA